MIEKIEISSRRPQTHSQMLITLADKVNEIIDVVNSRDVMYPELVAEVEMLKAASEYERTKE